MSLINLQLVLMAWFTLTVLTASSTEPAAVSSALYLLGVYIGNSMSASLVYQLLNAIQCQCGEHSLFLLPSSGQKNTLLWVYLVSEMIFQGVLSTFPQLHVFLFHVFMFTVHISQHVSFHPNVNVPELYNKTVSRPLLNFLAW